MEQPTIQPGIYEHFKDKRNEVLGVARHSETLEPFVVYKALYTSQEFGENALWIRPLAMFLEQITKDGKTMPRFRFIGKKEENP